MRTDVEERGEAERMDLELNEFDADRSMSVLVLVGCVVVGVAAIVLSVLF